MKNKIVDILNKNSLDSHDFNQKIIFERDFRLIIDEIIKLKNPHESEICELLIEAVETDGANHKQWYIEQIALKMGVELPDHEKGVSP